MGKLAIIDGDSLCYLGSKTDTLQQILEKVDNKIHEILVETKADYYVLLISKGKYFRHTISKSIDTPEGSYKSNRTYTTQPWVKTIKEYLIVKYKAVWYPNLEADDVAAWLMNKKEFDVSNQPELWGTINKILVAKEKDLLYSIPGKHLNFSKKLSSEEWGMEWIETSINDAPFFIWEQMVCGDVGDNVTGLWKKGKAWCGKNFESKSLREVQHLVFDEYIKDYGAEKGIYEFSKNYRLLYMLKTNEDFIREVGYIPTLPEFQKVSLNSQIEKLDDDLTF
jgi:hypothetical protein